MVIISIAAIAAPLRLDLIFMISTGTQRSAWADVVDRFVKDNPDIEVSRHELDQEGYKRRFSQIMAGANVDLAFWFAGDRLHQAVDARLVQPVDDVLGKDLEAVFNPAALEAVSWSGHRWAVPLNYYPWGMFYRRSVFAAHGLTPPTNWAQFQTVVAKLKAAGIAPTAVGNKSKWPAAAWFDYLDLRLNGLAFHRSLLAGKTSFHDPRVTKVFETWRGLMLAGAFLPGTAEMEWDEVLPYLYRGQVGMVLAGAFAAPKMPPNVLMDIDFFPFPALDDAQSRFEDAPLDVLVRAKSSRNGAAVKRLLAYLFKPDTLAAYSTVAMELAPLRNAAEPAGPVLQRGKAMLDTAGGIAFYFDRDAIAPIRDAGLEAFYRFTQPPYDIDAAINALAKASPAH
jgi:multiple sugar transport system substrate-binding protein